jgi:hypothetical protein
MPELPAADPLAQVVPVILGKRHQYRKRFGELIALVEGQLADKLKLSVHYTVQKVGISRHCAVLPPAEPVLPCHHVYRPAIPVSCRSCSDHRQAGSAC